MEIKNKKEIEALIKQADEWHTGGMVSTSSLIREMKYQLSELIKPSAPPVGQPSNNSIWEPFTERARRAIVLTQEEAQRLGNNYMGSEHIFMGILAEEDNLSAKALLNLNITLNRVRQEVESILGRSGRTVEQNMVFTPRAKKAIEYAFEYAREKNHNYISTEHLLYGLTRDNESVFNRVITNLGSSNAVIQMMIEKVIAE